MSKTKGLTRKQWKKVTGAPPYIIAYLSDCGRLPIIKESTGKEIPAVQYRNSVENVKSILFDMPG